MALISDYASLQTAVAEYLAREEDTTLIARIPSFIQLAEAKFNRSLFVRQMQGRATAAVDLTSSEPEFISLPSDFQSMTRIRLSSVQGKPVLDFKSSTQISEYRSHTANTPGRPLYFTIFGDEIELAPTPDLNYMIEMIYRKLVPPLADNDPNWLLKLAPDAYLYGTLLESAPYIKEDGRIDTWGTGLSSAVDALNGLSDKSSFNAEPLAISVSQQVV